MKKLKLFLFIICCSLLLGCNTSNEEVPEEITYLEKYSVKYMNDGWVYFMVINYPNKDDKEINTAYLGGKNIKYKVLNEDTGTPIINESGNEVGTVKGVMPDLMRIAKFKDELAIIHEFLTNHQFNEKISLADLDGLEVTNFPKEMLVEMYNEALTSEQSFGEYGNISSNCVQLLDNSNNTVQISYTINYGNISSFNLEYIYSDGTYLSEEVEKGTDASLLALQNKIDDYEKEIIKTQDYKTGHSFTEIDDLDKNVNALIKKIFELEQESKK